MAKLIAAIKRMILLTPIGTIVIVSFLPLQAWSRQALVLVALIWFHTFIIFDVLEK